MSVYYRFLHEKSDSYRSIELNVNSIRTSDLKLLVAEHAGLGKEYKKLFDLKVFDTEEKEAYPDDKLLPIYSRVVIQRIPWRELKEIHHEAQRSILSQDESEVVTETKLTLPSEYICKLCNYPLVNPVLIKCIGSCGASACRDCVKNYFEQNKSVTIKLCPSCGQRFRGSVPNKSLANMLATIDWDKFNYPIRDAENNVNDNNLTIKDHELQNENLIEIETTKNEIVNEMLDSHNERLEDTNTTNGNSNTVVGNSPETLLINNNLNISTAIQNVSNVIQGESETMSKIINNSDITKINQISHFLDSNSSEINNNLINLRNNEEIIQPISFSSCSPSSSILIQEGNIKPKNKQEQVNEIKNFAGIKNKINSLSSNLPIITHNPTVPKHPLPPHPGIHTQFVDPWNIQGHSYPTFPPESAHHYHPGFNGPAFPQAPHHPYNYCAPPPNILNPNIYTSHPHYQPYAETILPICGPYLTEEQQIQLAMSLPMLSEENFLLIKQAQQSVKDIWALLPKSIRSSLLQETPEYSFNEKKNKMFRKRKDYNNNNGNNNVNHSYIKSSSLKKRPAQ